MGQNYDIKHAQYWTLGGPGLFRLRRAQGSCPQLPGWSLRRWCVPAFENCRCSCFAVLTVASGALDSRVSFSLC